MKNFSPERWSIVLMSLVMLLVSGCANYIRPEQGAVVKPGARIDIPAKEVRDATFSADDLTIVYSLSAADQPFSLSGRVVFDQSLLNSFPVIARFTLKMSFLDQAGRVIETVDATPVYNAYGRVDRTLDFHVSRPAPPGSTAIAFNYTGEFRSDPREATGSWDIYYFPYE